MSSECLLLLLPLAKVFESAFDQMKWSFVLLFLLVTAANGQQFPNIRDQLLQMEKVDQDARTKCSNGTADEQINVWQRSQKLSTNQIQNV